MGNFLHFANEEEGKRYYYHDEEGNMTDEFIELRLEVSKKRANQLLKFAPRKEDDLDGGLRFVERAFAELVIGWSLDAPATVENYNKLSAKPAAWIDRSLGDHIRSEFGGEAAAAEGKQGE